MKKTYNEKCANNWNDMQIEFLVQYMKETIKQLETFEVLGGIAAKKIQKAIGDIEDLRSKYTIKE